MFDHRGDKYFHVAAIKGIGDVISSLPSEIPAADPDRPAYLITAESAEFKIERNTSHSTCGLITINYLLLNGGMSRTVLV